MVQSCAVEKLQNMDLDSQHLISTKCKLLKQTPNSPAFSLSNYAQCKDFTRMDLYK